MSDSKDEKQRGLCIEELFTQIKNDLGDQETDRIKSFYQNMSTQIKQMYDS